MREQGHSATLVVDTVTDHPGPAAESRAARVQNFPDHRVQPRINCGAAKWIPERHGTRRPMCRSERRFRGEPVHGWNVAIAGRRMAYRVAETVIGPIHLIVAAP